MNTPNEIVDYCIECQSEVIDLEDMVKTIKLDDGKYTIIYDKNNQYPAKCLRYGEDWQDLIGDNLIFHLCNKIKELEEEIDAMNDALNYYDDHFGNITV